MPTREAILVNTKRRCGRRWISAPDDPTDLTAMYTHYDFSLGDEVLIAAARVRSEVERHGVAWAEFVAAFGDDDAYDAVAVLEWLGW
jgi:hypothetical protein